MFNIRDQVQVAGYTIGWNTDEKLVPVPIVKRWVNVSTNKSIETWEFKTESIYRTALNRKCTIFLADEKLFELDRGYKRFEGEDWLILNQVVRALNGVEACQALRFIKERLKPAKPNIEMAMGYPFCNKCGLVLDDDPQKHMCDQIIAL